LEGFSDGFGFSLMRNGEAFWFVDGSLSGITFFLETEGVCLSMASFTGPEEAIEVTPGPVEEFFRRRQPSLAFVTDFGFHAQTFYPDSSKSSNTISLPSHGQSGHSLAWS
jgi:hypothetical protein